MPTELKERRFIQPREMRIMGEAGNTLAGHGAVYNQWTDVGGFYECVELGCFDESIREDEIRCLMNHNEDLLLGNNRADPPTLRLYSDSIGLAYECDLPDTADGAKVRELVGRGDLRGNSFSFRTIEDRWEMQDGKDARWLVKAKLYDVGPVTYPAYPQTDVALRSALAEVGLDFNALNLVLTRAQSQALEASHFDIIRAAIEALNRYLPPGEEPPGDAGAEAQARISLLRKRLELAAIQ